MERIPIEQAVDRIIKQNQAAPTPIPAPIMSAILEAFIVPFMERGFVQDVAPAPAPALPIVWVLDGDLEAVARDFEPYGVVVKPLPKSTI